MGCVTKMTGLGMVYGMLLSRFVNRNGFFFFAGKVVENFKEQEFWSNFKVLNMILADKHFHLKFGRQNYVSESGFYLFTT